jgi:hypothetical protein
MSGQAIKEIGNIRRFRRTMFSAIDVVSCTIRSTFTTSEQLELTRERKRSADRLGDERIRACRRR